MARVFEILGVVAVKGKTRRKICTYKFYPSLMQSPLAFFDNY